MPTLQCRAGPTLQRDGLAAPNGLKMERDKNKRECFKLDNRSTARILTAEVTPKHEVEHEKAVLVVLEGITQVDNEGVIDL